MTHLTKAKLLLYLGMIFVAGGVTGAVISLSSTRTHATEPTEVDKMCDHMQKRLKAKLQLNPEQERKVQPILDGMTREIASVHKRTTEQVGTIISKAHENLARELTPEQKLKLEEWKSERKENKQRRSKERNKSGDVSSATNLLESSGKQCSKD